MEKIGKLLRSSQGFWIISLALFLGLSFFSTYAMLIKRDALGFHPRDYNYFIEQAAKLTDPGLIKRFALNIEGHNWIGLQGIEGVKSLYQAIHNEYFRYFYAVLYLVFRNTLPIYLFFGMIYFLPVLYAAWIAAPPRLFSGSLGIRMKPADRHCLDPEAIKATSTNAGWSWQTPNSIFLCIFILMYTCFPGTLDTVSGDLRTRMLFSSAWSLVILAVYFERPFVEKLFFFAFLPFIREEGILLGAIVTALNFIQMSKKPGRIQQTVVFLGILLAATAAFLAFMNWGGYVRVDSQFNPLLIIATFLQNPLVLIALATGCAVLWMIFQQFKKHPDQLSAFAFWLVYSSIFFLTGMQFWSDASLWYQTQVIQGPISTWEVVLHAITWNQFSFFYTAAILMAALLGIQLAERKRRPLLIFTALLIGAMLSTTLLTLPKQLADWRKKSATAQLVWDFKAHHNPYQTSLLVDYSTYQAFYDYNRVVVYERLPVWIVYPNLEQRFYPQNKELAAREIARGIEYAVISRSSFRDVEQLANLADRKTVEIASNPDFLVLEIR